MKFNIEDFKKGKFAINCTTWESAIWFDDFCSTHRLEKPSEHFCSNVWDDWGKFTCFAITGKNTLIGHSFNDFYKEMGLKIYNVFKLDDYAIFRDAENGKCVEPKPDMVNHPQHYQGKYECIDLMIAMFGIESVKGFCKCNSFKYRFRADRKNGAEDIKKAEWYEDKLMELNKQSVPTRKVIRYRKRRKNDSNIN